MKQINEEDIVRCRECGAVLDEPCYLPRDERSPCPYCDSTSRSFSGHIKEVLTFDKSLGMKARHGKSGRPFYEAISTSELYKKAQKQIKKERVIDREKDFYFEKITDPETGEVIHHCDEPLSSHRGHGAAKPKKKENAPS